MGEASFEASGLEKKTHQGYFGEGMVAALAAAAGLDVFFPRLGHHADMQIYKPGPLGTSSGWVVVQVKSWSRAVVNPDGYFHYPLRVSAFNRLAGPNDVRHYLVLCAVPAEPEEYARAQHACLTMRRAAYWLSLRDMKPDPSLNPKSTKVVRVPRKNLLTPATLRALLDRKEDLAVER